MNVKIYYGNTSLLLDSEKAEKFKFAFENKHEYLKLDSLYIRMDAITHFELIPENEENEINISEYDFLSGF